MFHAQRPQIQAIHEQAAQGKRACQNHARSKVLNQAACGMARSPERCKNPPPKATNAGMAMIKKLWVFIKKSLF